MIIVTGAAGFIGSNILQGLNQAGITDILAVDDLTDGRKFKNMADAKIADYMDYADFIEKISQDKLSMKIDAVLHQGACSTTTEWDGRYMMKNNYDYSKKLLHYCVNNRLSFIYASSAAIYGLNQNCQEADEKQMPLNVYGYSKWLFDQYVLQHLSSIKSQIVGLRYFNIYGPREEHKGGMASVAYHFTNQLRETGVIKLFAGCDGYADGEQRRDFVFVDDVVKVNLWFLRHKESSGIYNVGTGTSRSFNELANTLIQLHGSGKIEYVPFPEKLRGHYQSFTQADVSALHTEGYNIPFYSLEQGLEKYFARLTKAAVEELV